MVDPSLWFLRGKFHPEMGSPSGGIKQGKGGKNKPLSSFKGQ